MTDVFWQSVILLRGLLDSKNETMYTPIDIGFDLDGITSLNVFDAVLSLVILMNWHVNTVKNEPLQGQLYLPNAANGVCLDLLFNGLKPDGSPEELKLGNPYKLSSFNFDVRDNQPFFYATLDEMEYLEPDVFKPMLDAVLDRVSTSVGEALMKDVRNIYDYLEQKLLQTTTIHEFRQVTTAYETLFLVDPYRNWDSNTQTTDEILMDSFDLTQTELNQLRYFVSQNPDTIEIPFHDQVYTTTTDAIMNQTVLDIEFENHEKMFQNGEFVDSFILVMSTYHGTNLDHSTLPISIKSQYQNIMSDKAMLDIGYSVNGCTTFDSLLYRNNVRLYRKLMSLKNDGTSLLLLMRAIIKALETYTNASLTGLELNALGTEDYFTILKEIITYFKSYMVEFTKEEFEYVMDGLFDYGGHSNMLRLYDEVHELDIIKNIPESLTLFDVSNSEIHKQFQDDCVGFIQDDMLLRGESTYADIKNMGLDIWYDWNGQIIHEPPSESIPDSDLVTFTRITKNNHDMLILDVKTHHPKPEPQPLPTTGVYIRNLNTGEIVEEWPASDETCYSQAKRYWWNYLEPVPYGDRYAFVITNKVTRNAFANDTDPRIGFKDSNMVQFLNYSKQTNVIPPQYFSGCDKLEELHFEEISSIYPNAIWYTPNLKELRINTRAELGPFIFPGSFDNTPNLEKIYITMPENSISGAPWGATNAEVIWLG